MRTLRLVGAAIVAGVIGSAVSVQVQAQENHAAAVADVEKHVTDVQTLLRELSGITTAAQASAYEAKLKGQVSPFLKHVKKVDGHGPGLQKAFLAGGNVHPNVVKARKHYEDMNQNVYPKLSAEMERVEKLQPSLKPLFDQIRNMHAQKS